MVLNILNNYLPITEWLKNYKLSTLKHDLPAGLSVGIVLIPQGIAYAIIADIPPIYGLYTALIPQLVYAIFGTSRQLSVGPVAMDSLIVAAGVSVIASVGTEYYIAMASLLALMMGVIQFLFGCFRLGFLVNFLSKPVISGFTSAAALIIGLNQIKHITGAEIVRSNKVQELLLNIIQHINDVNIYTIMLSIFALAIILLFDYKKIKFPSTLVVVGIGILAVYFFKLDTNGVKIIETIPAGLPSFKFPEISKSNVEKLLYLSFTLSLIAFMEAISIAKAIEDKNRTSIVQPNQELIALGLSNIVGSFFQTYPASGGFSRSALNNQSGAKTPMSSIVAAFVVGLTLIFLTELFYFLPKSILGAVIIGAVIRLIDFKYPFELIKYRKDEFLMLFLTFLVTLTVGISEGIITGVIISLILLIFRSARPHVAECVQVEGTNQFRNKNRFENTNDRKDVLIIRFDGQLYFANCQYFKQQLKSMIAKKGDYLKYIILNAECINHLDSTAIKLLAQLIEELKEEQINFMVSGSIGPVRDIIFKSDLIKIIGENMLFASVEKAVFSIDNKSFTSTDNVSKIATQTNK